MYESNETRDACLASVNVDALFDSISTSSAVLDW
jgi:hypothetical protein